MDDFFSCLDLRPVSLGDPLRLDDLLGPQDWEEYMNVPPDPGGSSVNQDGGTIPMLYGEPGSAVEWQEGAYREIAEPDLGHAERRLKKMLPILVITAMGAILLVFLPSLVFCFSESWSYATSFYFSIVTLSTIGFGDHVAALDEEGELSEHLRAFYRIMTSAWIIVGLSWFASVISVFQVLMSEAVNKTEDIMEDIMEDVIDDIKSLAGISDEETDNETSSVSKKDNSDAEPAESKECRSGNSEDNKSDAEEALELPDNSLVKESNSDTNSGNGRHIKVKETTVEMAGSDV